MEITFFGKIKPEKLENQIIKSSDHPKNPFFVLSGEKQGGLTCMLVFLRFFQSRPFPWKSWKTSGEFRPLTLTLRLLDLFLRFLGLISLEFRAGCENQIKI